MIERPNKGDVNCAENNLYREFETRINSFVKAYLDKYTPCMYDKTKRRGGWIVFAYVFLYMAQGFLPKMVISSL